MVKDRTTSVFTGVLASAVGVLHIFNSFSTHDHVNIRKLDSNPLSTTLDHILRLNGCMSTAFFEVGCRDRNDCAVSGASVEKNSSNRACVQARHKMLRLPRGCRKQLQAHSSQLQGYATVQDSGPASTL